MLSPAIEPFICGRLLLSIASPAALAHPGRVFTRIIFPDESTDEVPENVPEETTPDEPAEKAPVAVPAEKKVTRNVQRKTTRGRKK